MVYLEKKNYKCEHYAQSTKKHWWMQRKGQNDQSNPATLQDFMIGQLSEIVTVFLTAKLGVLKKKNVK